MKPNFALTLSFEGIGLLHRTFPGWHLVDEVTLDTADLAGDLAVLRGKALALDPSGVTTKLVIPNDQIRYLDFDAAGVAEDGYADAARKALDGATPYAVDDLAFDWSVGSGRVFVAAVARETLHEAENFAIEHGFNPVSYVATPDATAFVGEPFFGETRFAAGHLDGADQVERDPAAIRIIGAARLPEPEALNDDGALPMPAPETPLPAARETPAKTPDIPPAPPADAPAFEPSPDTGSEPDTPDTDKPETPPQDPAPSEPATTSEGGVTFASIRVRRDDAPAARPKLAGATRADPPAPAPRPARSEPPAPAPVAEAPAPPDDVPEVTGIPDDALSQDQAARIGATLRADENQRLIHETEVAPPPEPVHEDPTEVPAPGIAERVSFFTRRAKDRRRSARVAAVPAQSPRVPTPQDEEQRMTVFGARDTGASRGRPRFFALILTAVLLLFLVGVAAWASIFLDEGLARFFRGADDTRVASVPDDATGTLPDLADAQTDQQAEDIVIASLTPDEQPPEPRSQVTLPDAQPAELTADEARARYAATGIWQMAPDVPRPPSPTTLEEFYQTSIDPDVIINDAVALPDAGVQLTDTALEPPSNPPAAGLVFRHDSRGFILATPEGTMTPDGVLVFSGKPPLLPPAAALRGVQSTPEEEVAEAAAPAIASIRPKLRPGDLTEQAERGQLAGRTRAELASIRPKLRPKSAQEAAEEAAIAAAVAAAQAAEEITTEEAVAAAAAAAAANPFAGATAQAVSASLKPKNRPRNFASIVKKSQQTVAAQPVSATQRVAPKIPTTASVARAATEKDRIKLRKVNLIGVYGKPQSRRALVRLANGRYTKVKVGDRLDGGKVAAIGASELRYIKSGRSVILKMPKG